MFGRKKNVELLQRNGMQVRTVADNNKEQILFEACIKGYEEVAKALLKNGTRFNPERLSKIRNKTILELVLHEIGNSLSQYQLDTVLAEVIGVWEPALMEVLLKYGANVNSKDFAIKEHYKTFLEKNPYSELDSSSYGAKPCDITPFTVAMLASRKEMKPYRGGIKGSEFNAMVKTSMPLLCSYGVDVRSAIKYNEFCMIEIIQEIVCASKYSGDEAVCLLVDNALDKYYGKGKDVVVKLILEQSTLAKSLTPSETMSKVMPECKYVKREAFLRVTDLIKFLDSLSRDWHCENIKAACESAANINISSGIDVLEICVDASKTGKSGRALVVEIVDKIFAADNARSL